MDWWGRERNWLPKKDDRWRRGLIKKKKSYDSWKLVIKKKKGKNERKNCTFFFLFFLCINIWMLVTLLYIQFFTVIFCNGYNNSFDIETDTVWGFFFLKILVFFLTFSFFLSKIMLTFFFSIMIYALILKI